MVTLLCDAAATRETDQQRKRAEEGGSTEMDELVSYFFHRAPARMYHKEHTVYTYMYVLPRYPTPDFMMKATKFVDIRKKNVIAKKEKGGRDVIGIARDLVMVFAKVTFFLFFFF